MTWQLEIPTFIYCKGEREEREREREREEIPERERERERGNCNVHLLVWAVVSNIDSPKE